MDGCGGWWPATTRRRACCPTTSAPPARALAGGLSRQIKAKEDAETYHERLRLRSLGDEVVHALARADNGDLALEDHLRDLLRLADADGVAVFRDDRIEMAGKAPQHVALAMLRDWLVETTGEGDAAAVTDQATAEIPDLAPFRTLASGLMGVVIERSPCWPCCGPGPKRSKRCAGRASR
jgi:chemotaxis family two-component system sensor kinase Cph1